jgi:hypothetical protein
MIFMAVMKTCSRCHRDMGQANGILDGLFHAVGSGLCKECRASQSDRDEMTRTRQRDSDMNEMTICDGCEEEVSEDEICDSCGKCSSCCTCITIKGGVGDMLSTSMRAEKAYRF